MPRLPDFHDRYIPEPNSGCWLWIGGMHDRGYGWHSQQYAHRESWMIHRGAIPAGLYVCHKCDVPSCVNPDHLFLGTPADNARDMTAKGRARRAGRGVLNHNALLNEDKVRAILRDPRSHAKIARSYGVATGCISSVKSRLNWAWVTL